MSFHFTVITNAGPLMAVSLTIEEIIQRPDIWISQELCHIVLDQLKSEIAQSP